MLRKGDFMKMQCMSCKCWDELQYKLQDLSLPSDEIWIGPAPESPIVTFASSSLSPRRHVCAERKSAKRRRESKTFPERSSMRGRHAWNRQLHGWNSTAVLELCLSIYIRVEWLLSELSSMFTERIWGWAVGTILRQLAQLAQSRAHICTDVNQRLR